MRRLAWLLGVLLTGAVTPVLAALIAVGPYTVSTTVPFVVPILVTGAVSLDSFTFDLTYDPSAFRINTACDPFSGDVYCDLLTGPVTPGTFYTSVSSDPQLFNPGFILLTPGGDQIGRLLAVNGAWQGPGPSPSGDGILAYVEFIAVPGGSLTSPITVVGTPPAVVPEPASLLLVASGLVFLVQRRRRPPR